MVDAKGWQIKNLLLDSAKPDPQVEKNSLGWDIYPKGFYDVLILLKKRYEQPIFILENGICTDDDTQRERFISSHIEAMKEAIRDGADIIGYVYWSLLDNYEWDEGFAPKFGLIEVDYNTFDRKVRESAKKLSF